jgi:hypothetical protein
MIIQTAPHTGQWIYWYLRHHAASIADSQTTFSAAIGFGFDSIPCTPLGCEPAWPMTRLHTFRVWTSSLPKRPCAFAIKVLNVLHRFGTLFHYLHWSGTAATHSKRSSQAAVFRFHRCLVCTTWRIPLLYIKYMVYILYISYIYIYITYIINMIHFNIYIYIVYIL